MGGATSAASSTCPGGSTPATPAGCRRFASRSSTSWTSEHPFYRDGAAERELFLARRGGRVVGRIAAILNRAYNAFHGDRAGFFGFFECEDDPAAASELLAAAADWLRGKGCDLMLGPVNPSTNDEAGLLVEGFDTPPTVMMTYNPRRYAELLEAAGLAKAKDLFAYLSEVHPASLDRLAKFAERTSKREPELESRSVDMKQFDAEVAQVRTIYNSAWEKNWGFVPASDAEFAALAKELKPLVDPELVRLAYFAGEPAGFLLALPDVNPALAVLDGSLWNPIRLLRASIVGRRKVGPAAHHHGRHGAAPAAGHRGRHVLPGPQGRPRQRLRVVRVLLDPRGQRARQAHRAPDGRQAVQGLPDLRQGTVAPSRPPTRRSAGNQAQAISSPTHPRRHDQWSAAIGDADALIP